MRQTLLLKLMEASEHNLVENVNVYTGLRVLLAYICADHIFKGMQIAKGRKKKLKIQKLTDPWII
jgi:hypothetical protein